MRIVHTCLRYPPAIGGVETYVREVVERTRNIDAGRDVRVITSSMRTHGPISMLDPDSLLDDPPYVQRVHTNITPFISYPRLDALDYYLGHHQPDIVQAYGFWYQPADVAARYARKNQTPFILYPMFYSNAVRRKALWRLYQRTVGQKTFAAADVVAVISPYEQELVARAGFPVKRFTLLPPGVDSQKFSYGRPNPFAARGITGNVLLMVSRLSAGKGIDDAITVFRQLAKKHTNVSLVIIGEDFGAGKQLKQLAQDGHDSSKIHFWGSVDEKTLLAAYQHATIFVHASHDEAFGIVLAEASAAGKPVVARQVAAIPFVAPHQQTGLLFTTNDDMYKAADTLLTKPDLAVSLGKQGQQHIQKNFTWESTIKKLTALYDELGQAKPP